MGIGVGGGSFRPPKAAEKMLGFLFGFAMKTIDFECTNGSDNTSKPQNFRLRRAILTRIDPQGSEHRRYASISMETRVIGPKSVIFRLSI